MRDDLPDTTSFGIIHPDGVITSDYNGPPIGVLIPSAAFPECRIICLAVPIVQRVRDLL